MQSVWDHTVDLWNLVCLIWYLIEGELLFDCYDDGEHSVEKHLAEMFTLLGPPPASIIELSPVHHRYFATDGIWVSRKP